MQFYTIQANLIDLNHSFAQSSFDLFDWNKIVVKIGFGIKGEI
jgi:hypothetical protein